jgi:hypothetical protein
MIDSKLPEKAVTRSLQWVFCRPGHAELRPVPSTRSLFFFPSFDSPKSPDDGAALNRMGKAGLKGPPVTSFLLVE